MRKIILFLLLLANIQSSKALNITSTATGGNWSNTATWVGGVVPGTSDTATIAGPVTLDAARSITRLVINSGKTFTMSYNLTVYGEVVNNGTRTGSYTAIIFMGSNQTIMAGKGAWTSAGFGIETFGVNAVIDSTVYWHDCGFIYLINVYSYVSVINKGRIIMLTNRMIDAGASYHPATWTNYKNSYLELTNLYISSPSLGNAHDTLHVSAVGDTFTCYGSGTAYTIKQPAENKVCNLFLAGTIKLPSSLIISNLLYMYASSTVNINGQNITIGGNWADYGTASNNTGTVTFNAIGSQCVLRTSGTESFTNMVIARTSKLGTNCTVSASGTVTLQPGGSMDCTCP